MGNASVAEIARTSSPGARLRALLARPDILTLPGVYDGISARVAESVGFPALYMTGYGAVASGLGLPDAGVASYTEMVGILRRLVEISGVPIVADGDTGYGGLINVRRTVRGYERAGAAAIQIEDQEFPKKCGHMPGRRVVPAHEAAARIRVAVQARLDPDFMIIARTDARSSLGLDAALSRAEMFLREGADILFIESPDTVEELRRIGEAFRGAILVANMVPGGRTPVLSAAELQALGFSVALFPAAGFLAAAGALRASYAGLHRSGATTPTADAMEFADMGALMGFPEVYALEASWAALEDGASLEEGADQAG